MVNHMERALQFFREHADVAFATSDGQVPKQRVFRIMKQEGNRLYFATSVEKAVWRELTANPNIEILAAEGDVSVRCSGMVNFDVDDDIKRWIYDHNPVLPRLYDGYDKLAYFCLPIAEIDYYDLTPTPPVLLHFDLMAGEVEKVN